MPFRSTACSTAFGLVVLLATPRLAPAQPPDDHRPRLVVLIVVDQLRADYLTRFERFFGDDGFKRLMRKGAHFTNAYFSYGASVTASGHATISTGRIPRQHGITTNRWFTDPKATDWRAAIDDDVVRSVPGEPDEPAPGRSPKWLIGPALGDQMKVSDARSRVFSIALKDRAAIFMGGRRPDGVFWWDRRTGRFMSSTYYCEKLPEEVAAFNRDRVADRYFGKSWARLLPAEAYAGCRPVHPDWPGNFCRLGPTFPHVLPSSGDGPDARFYNALWCTPFGNDLVLDLVERIVTHRKLGAGPATDLLCVGFSSNDLCGHYFGPDSPETLDMTVQTDRQLARLLAMLDRTVGLGRCVVTLTADHGATTAPCLARELGQGGGYIDPGALVDRLNAQLTARFPSGATGDTDPRLVLGIEPPWVYLNTSRLDGLDARRRARLLAAAAEALRTTDGIAEVFTADELAGAAPSREDTHRRLAWRCYHPGRSGQLYVRLKDYWYKTGKKIAGHTNGFNHDRHVPILITGPRVRPGRYFSAARPCDIAVTLAAILGIEPPLDATGRVLAEAFDTRPPK
ncbi:MAG: alkaline phosphatase family protein [Phycisphaerae bacterium]